MKVKELIEKLKEFDPETDVRYDYDDGWSSIDIKNICEALAFSPQGNITIVLLS